jgi:hypothetical protein
METMTSRALRAACAGLLLGGAVLAARTVAAAEPVQRIGVLVGANAAAPGRQPLRYAHRDAERLAEALQRVGGFSPADLHVLRDPSPEELVQRLEQVRLRLRSGPGDRQTLLFFYYSGHADESLLYPGGRPLPLERLRALLDEPGVTVRVGFIDACQGGAWTRAKGLHEVAPFAVPLSTLRSEGSVLIASSSGSESAHESDLLRGSFFTHHFTAGLLGAADQTGDGEVSLNEAFDYAKRLTIRDSARYAKAPQHPSFDLRLRGRQDLVLAQLPASASTLVIEQEHGSLEVVQLSTGAVVSELPAGRRATRLALQPGRYLVRRAVRRVLSAGEIEVAPGAATVVRERELAPVGPLETTGRKGASVSGRLLVTSSTAERGVVELRAGLGIDYSPPSGLGVDSEVQRDPTAMLSGVLGITDRLQWSIGTGAFAYRFGRRGGTEWIPWGGLLRLTLGFGTVESMIFGYGLGAGLNLRRWLTSEHSLILGLGASSQGHVSALRRVEPTTWRSRFELGVQLTARRVLTFNLAAALSTHFLVQGQLPAADVGSPELDLTVHLGAVQSLGLRPLPLVQLHLSRYFTLDAYAGLAIRVRDGALRDSYMLGFTFLAF